MCTFRVVKSCKSEVFSHRNVSMTRSLIKRQITNFQKSLPKKKLSITGIWLWFNFVLNILKGPRKVYGNFSNCLKTKNISSIESFIAIELNMILKTFIIFITISNKNEVNSKSSNSLFILHCFPKTAVNNIS